MELATEVIAYLAKLAKGNIFELENYIHTSMLQLSVQNFNLYRFVDQAKNDFVSHSIFDKFCCSSTKQT